MAKRQSVSEVARELIQLKADLKRMEIRKEELEAILTPALLENDDRTLMLHGWQFKLIHRENRSFSLSQAEKVIDGRTLAPYIKKSESDYIGMTWQGGEEKAA